MSYLMRLSRIWMTCAPCTEVAWKSEADMEDEGGQLIKKRNKSGKTDENRRNKIVNKQILPPITFLFISYLIHYIVWCLNREQNATFFFTLPMLLLWHQKTEDSNAWRGNTLLPFQSSRIHALVNFAIIVLSFSCHYINFNTSFNEQQRNGKFFSCVRHLRLDQGQLE